LVAVAGLAGNHHVVARLEPQGPLARSALGPLALSRLDLARGLPHLVEHVGEGGHEVGCYALSQLAAHDDSKVLMTRAGAHEALLDVVDRDGDQDEEDWGEAAQDADPMDLALVPSARLALPRLAANADSRVDDLWPVVVDRLRLIRIELLDLSVWQGHSQRRLAPLS
jgi:hypothetical protein